MNPEQFQERILLCVTGLSPQVVTETLYALTQKQQPAFVPNRIVILTTADGAERVRLQLLSNDKAWFQKFREEYNLPQIRFNESDIRVIRDESGHELHDIRTLEQNSCVADQISETIRELAASENTAIHASIAGGRKSMGFYLGYAMSLFGRPQDRLSHVLVDEGYEGHREFFYPTKERRVIYTRDEKPLDTAKAGVMLADIPFVRLRDGLPDLLLQGEARFSETIEAAQRMYQPPSLLVDTANKTLFCNGVAVRLSPVPFALYLSMIERVCSEKGLAAWDDEDYKSEFLGALARMVSKASSSYEEAEKSVYEDFVESYFAPHVSKIKKVLKKTLGKKGAEPYLIYSYGKRGAMRYGLNLEPDQIQTED